MLLIENIDYKIEKFRLSVSDLSLPNKGLVRLKGDSGSGKSTLIKLLVGYETSSDVNWSFNGVKMETLAVKDKKIGLIMQGAPLFPHLSVRACIEMIGSTRDNSFQLDTLVPGLLARLNLNKDILKKKIRVLSGGERQRVALICALVSRSQLFMFDEPFSNLDSKNKFCALEVLKDHCLAQKKMALIVTHENFPDHYFESQVFLDKGKIRLN